MLKIREGGHVELERYYSLMEVDFDSEELMSRSSLHRAMMKGSAQLLIAYDSESGMDGAYVLVLPKNIYGYVLIKYMGVLPWYRGQGIGLELMRLINRRYSDSQGIIAEISHFPDEDKDRVKKLHRFFSRFGYERLDLDYRIKGVETDVYVKPMKGAWDIAPVAHRILPDFYTRCISASAARDMLSIGRG